MQQSTALREIDKPHYNYWQALVLAFFSPRLFVDVAKRWTGLGIFYLFLAVFVLATPFALRVANDFNRFFDERLINTIRDLPPITIQNGEISFNKPMPYLIKNKDNKIVAIIDTTGVMDEKTNQYPDLAILITKNRFIFWPPSPSFFFNKTTKTQRVNPVVQMFPSHTNEVFDGERWLKKSGIENVKFLSLAIIYPTVILIFFVIYLVFYLVFTMIAQLAAKLFFDVSLSYAQACRLLIVSATATMAVMLLGLAINELFAGFGLLLIILLAFYYSFAAIAVRNESKKLVLG